VNSDRDADQLCALEAAVKHGDQERLDQLLDAMGDQVPPAARRLAGDRLMIRCRWADAARMFDLVEDRETTCELKRRLVWNLDSVQRHRPQVYEALNASLTSGRYQPATASNAQLTIVRRDSNGQSQAVGPLDDPTGAVRGALGRLPQPYRDGDGVALVGIGDGHMLAELAAQPHPLPIGQQAGDFPA
jgi:Arc/MetJ family transcription regulator